MLDPITHVLSSSLIVNRTMGHLVAIGGCSVAQSSFSELW